MPDLSLLAFTDELQRHGQAGAEQFEDEDDEDDGDSC
jgi:hypothetical protein